VWRGAKAIGTFLTWFMAAFGLLAGVCWAAARYSPKVQPFGWGFRLFMIDGPRKEIPPIRPDFYVLPRAQARKFIEFGEAARLGGTNWFPATTLPGSEPAPAWAIVGPFDYCDGNIGAFSASLANLFDLGQRAAGGDLTIVRRHDL
jgi:hypothetical protein